MSSAAARERLPATHRTSPSIRRGARGSGAYKITVGKGRGAAALGRACSRYLTSFRAFVALPLFFSCFWNPALSSGVMKPGFTHVLDGGAVDKGQSVAGGRMRVRLEQEKGRIQRLLVPEA